VRQCDVVQFFPNVDHAILRGMLSRRIADVQVMNLIDMIIDSGARIHTPAPQWFPGDDLLAAARPRGLPIGNQTSQFWANVYLHELDRFVKQTLRCRAYVRYCDDFLLFGDDKPTLHAWRGAVEDFLVRLRLRLHGRKTVVYPVTNGIPFLGFLVFADHRRLQQVNGLRFQRRLKRMLGDYVHGRIDGPELHGRVRSWVAHADHGDTYGLRRSIFGRHPIPPVEEDRHQGNRFWRS